MTELLAPAGSKEALVAAVQNGADAVYLGVDEFNARRGARNFSPEELHAAAAYCHLRGVRVYLTLNTLVNDRELHALSSAARVANEAGVDAILVQDWGVLDTLRRVVPDMPLHASTQMTVHTLSGVREAARLGVARAVLARELSRDEIRELCEKSPIELEVFVHGALCMCYSGQCAMSAVIGQRSGNRGLCAQPCRLPYNGAHPLSLRDNDLAAYVPELQDMGVACLKLEGRMKRPEYVAAVTGIYARLLREHRAATGEEQAQLAAAFSRDGFTDGYYRNEKNADMFGVRPANARWPEEWFARLRADYDRGDLRKVPVRFAAKLALGEPAQLLAGDAVGLTVSVAGPEPEPARTRSVTA
ncbi:MAG: U32 family peptidase, partial [Oscillospiraceae bacterium]|nr:U32 family peptidase [Oscillospiraceae bacterium]